jgi:hypothetical protein
MKVSINQTTYSGKTDSHGVPNTYGDCDSNCDSKESISYCNNNQILWTWRTCKSGCPNQPCCSNVYKGDCPIFGYYPYISTSTGAITVDPSKSSPHPTDGKTMGSRSISCSYNLSDFSNTQIVKDYAAKMTTNDPNYNDIIMPYFCSLNADSKPSWAASQEPVSKFHSTGEDSTLCSDWCRHNQTDCNRLKNDWCDNEGNQYATECKCLNRSENENINDFESDIVSPFSINPGCWYEPCQDSSRYLLDSNIYPSNDSRCSSACTLINSKVNDLNYDYSNVESSVSCDLSPNRQQKCADNDYTSLINESISLNEFQSEENKQLVRDKIKFYETSVCAGGTVYLPEVLSTWVKQVPVLTAYPIYKSDGTVNNYISTSASDIDEALNILHQMFSPNNAVCHTGYTVNIDPYGGTSGTRTLVNEKYATCNSNYEEAMSTPLPDGTCPNQRYLYDFYTGESSYVDATPYLNDCISNPSYVDYTIDDDDNDNGDDEEDDNDNEENGDDENNGNGDIPDDNIPIDNIPDDNGDEDTDSSSNIGLIIGGIALIGILGLAGGITYYYFTREGKVIKSEQPQLI